MASEQNFDFESTRIKIPMSSNENTSDDPVESVSVDLTKSLMIDDREDPASPPKSLELKDKLSGLNSKLSSYVAHIKKTESRLADALRKVKRLEEANSVLKEDSLQQLAFVRAELDDQIRKTVLAEDERSTVEQRLESCSKRLTQMGAELETHRKRVEELEGTLNVERRRSKDALEEIVSLREQMVQERTEYNEQKQQMMNLKIDHAKLQERFKISSVELTSSQSRLGEFQNNAQFTAEEVQRKLSELKQRLEKKYSDLIAAKLHEKQNEITNLKEELQVRLNEVVKTSISPEDFELLKNQLEEHQRRTVSAESDAADWRKKCQAAESELERAGKDYAKKLEEERRRRKELNKRLLTQSRAQDEVRLELETYRKLIEGLDQGDGFLAGCLSPLTTPEGITGPPLSPGSPLGRLQLAGGTPNSPDARSRLLRKALTPRKRSTTEDTESFIQVMNIGRGQSHET